VDDILLTLGIALALFLAFMSGFRDGGNLIAANVLSRSVTPQRALYLACAGELLGPFFLGSAVAATLGREVLDMSTLEGQTGLLCLCAAAASAATWSLLTWWAGAPAGATHTFLGGLLGGLIGALGLSGVNWSIGSAKILLVLFIVPITGFLASALIMTLPNMHLPRSKGEPGKGQWLTLFVLSAGHGANNAHKTTALITMMLLASGYLSSFEVPFWSVFCAAVALTLGLSLGAWKILKIFGRKTFRITPVQSLVSQGSAGAVVLGATLLGCPVSTNQIVKSSLVGAGPAERQREPSRIVIKDILIAWLVNFPAAAVMAAALYWIASGALGHGMGSFENIMEFMGQ
jgi:inorganic phosphate transporter, PiT family